MSSKSPSPDKAPARPRRDRRYSRATVIGSWLAAGAAVMLAWSSYTLLASLRLFAFLLGKSPLIDEWALWGLAAGALLALVAFELVLVGLARTGLKPVPVLLLVAALVLPVGATAGGLHLGNQELRARTVASAKAHAGKVPAEKVSELFDFLEAIGVNVPGREESVEIIKKADPSAPH